MTRRHRDEKGMALIMALLVVALLTISVVEFFYSAEVDSRMARNSVHSLQASLLARSGITLGETLLTKDEDFAVDSFLEEWCPSPGREGRACQIEDGGGLVTIPDGMRLRVEIWDESGKINVNFSRPRDVNVWRAARNTAQSGARTQPFQWWIDALARVYEARGVNPEAALALEDYWNEYFEQRFGPAGGTPGPTGGTPTPVGVATPNLVSSQLHLFASLEDMVAAGIGLSATDLRRIRPFVTAGPIYRLQLNINTASRDVLLAILGDSDAVENIITQRQSEPITVQNLASLVTTSNEDPAFRNGRSMLTTASDVYLIRSSAIVNINPITGRGGISRSAEMIVRRQRRVQPGVANVNNRGPNAGFSWTLTRLYWQKEGGAVLFRPEVESGAGETMDSAGY